MQDTEKYNLDFHMQGIRAYNVFLPMLAVTLSIKKSSSTNTIFAGKLEELMNRNFEMIHTHTNLEWFMRNNRILDVSRLTSHSGLLFKEYVKRHVSLNQISAHVVFKSHNGAELKVKYGDPYSSSQNNLGSAYPDDNTKEKIVQFINQVKAHYESWPKYLEVKSFHDQVINSAKKFSEKSGVPVTMTEAHLTRWQTYKKRPITNGGINWHCYTGMAGPISNRTVLPRHCYEDNAKWRIRPSQSKWGAFKIESWGGYCLKAGEFPSAITRGKKRIDVFLSPCLSSSREYFNLIPRRSGSSRFLLKSIVTGKCVAIQDNFTEEEYVGERSEYHGLPVLHLRTCNPNDPAQQHRIK